MEEELDITMPSLDTEKQLPCHVVLALDESGSMQSLLSECIGGVNKFLLDMKAEDREYVVSILKFEGTNIKWLYRNRPKFEVYELEPQDYVPAGMTPLYDAIGFAITETEKVLEAGQQCMVVVMTDGAENMSRRFSAAQINALLKAKDADGWAFIYLGVAPEAWGAASSQAFQGTNLTSNFVQTKGMSGLGASWSSASSARVMYAATSNTRLYTDEEKERLQNL